MKLGKPISIIYDNYNKNDNCRVVEGIYELLDIRKNFLISYDYSTRLYTDELNNLNDIEMGIIITYIY